MEFNPKRHGFIANLIARCNGFEWDRGNSGKNWIGHQVSDKEAEQVFVCVPLKFADDPKHSQIEPRYLALGKTRENRLQFVAFTIRGLRMTDRAGKIRIISARDMNARDKKDYAE